MAQPVVTWSLNWGNNTAQKLSGKTYRLTPSGSVIDCNTLGVTITTPQFKKLYVTAVKDGNDYGFINDVLVDIEGSNPTGVKLYESSVGAIDSYTFTITASTQLTAGDGIYRIGLYLQDLNNVWNYEYFFITTESDGTHDYIELAGNDDLLMVPVIR